MSDDESASASSDSDSSNYDVDKQYPLFDYIPLHLNTKDILNEKQTTALLKPFTNFQVSVVPKCFAPLLMKYILKYISDYFKINVEAINWMNPLPDNVLAASELSSDNDYLLHKDLIYILWKSKLIPLLVVLDEDSSDDVLQYIRDDSVKLPIILVSDKDVAFEKSVQVFNSLQNIKNEKTLNQIVDNIELSLQGKVPVKVMSLLNGDKDTLKLITPYVFLQLLTSFSKIGISRDVPGYNRRKIKVPYLNKSVLEDENHICITNNPNHPNLSAGQRSSAFFSYYSFDETLKFLGKDDRAKHFLENVDEDHYELIQSTDSIEDLKKYITDDPVCIKPEKFLYTCKTPLRFLFGAKKTGKTTFLRHLQSNVPAGYLVLYINVQQNLKLMDGLVYQEKDFYKFLVNNILGGKKDVKMDTFFEMLIQKRLENKSILLLLDDFTASFSKYEDLLAISRKMHINLFMASNENKADLFLTLPLELVPIAKVDHSKAHPLFEHIPFKSYTFKETLNSCQSSALLKIINSFNITRLSKNNASVVTTAVFKAISKYFNFKIEGLNWNHDIPKYILDVISVSKKTEFEGVTGADDDLSYKDLIYLLWKIRAVPLVVEYNEKNKEVIDKFISMELGGLSMVLISDLEVEASEPVKVFGNINDVMDEDLRSKTLDIMQVSFQGKLPISLGNIVSEQPKILETITPDVYVMLMTKYATIGNLEDHIPYYVRRKLKIPLLRPTVLEETQHLFIVNDGNYPDVHQYLDAPILNIITSELPREEILKLLVGIDRPIHILEKTSDNFYELQSSQGSIGTLLKHLVEDEAACKYEDYFYDDTTPSLKLLHGGTGTGKTTFLKQLQRRVQSDVFTIFLNVKENLEELCKLDYKPESFIKHLVNFLVQDDEMKPFLLALLELKLQQNSVMLLVDVNDEAFTKIRFLVSCTTHLNINTWVTINKGQIQEDLSCLALQFLPFDESDQILFLENFYKFTVSDEDRRDDLLTKIVSNSSEIMCNSFGTPIVLKVMADIFEFISEFDRDTISSFFVDNDEINDKNEVIRWMLSNRDNKDIAEAIKNCIETDILEKMLDIFKVDLKSTDIYNRSILWDAVGKQNLEAIKILLAKDVNLKCRDLTTGRSIFHEIARIGNVKIANILREKIKFRVDLEDYNQETPIFDAVKSNEENMVQWYIKLKSQVMKTNGSLKTPLYEATVLGNLNIATMLLENGAEVNAADNDGTTALYCAVLYGHDDIAKLLISKGADVNSQESVNGFNPLHLVSMTKNVGLAEMMLQNGANLQLSDNQGRTPITVAMENNKEMFELLNTGVNAENLIQDAIATSTVDNVKDLMITLKFNVDQDDENGESAIYWSIANNRVDMVKFFIKLGAQLTKVNKKGENLMIKAIMKGNVDIAMELHPHFPDLNYKYQDKSLLYYAILYHHNDMISWLLVNGAEAIDDLMYFCVRLRNVSAAKILKDYIDLNAVGDSSMCLAVMSGYTDMVKFLIEAGVDVTRVDPRDSTTLMHKAAAAGNAKICSIFKDENLSLEAVDVTGWTPIFYAADYNKLQTVDWFIKNNVNVNVKDIRNGKTVLHRMAEHGYENIVAKLLEHPDVDVNSLDENHWSPLVHAVCNNRSKVVKLLLENGADWTININEFGGKVFHWVAKNGNTDIADVLYQYNKDVNEEEDDGCSPMFYAMEYENNEMVDWLYGHFDKVIV